jgi:quercetin dioxygenase-like cupin family protein
MRNGLKAAIAGTTMLGAMLVPATAQATPGYGVAGTIITQKTIGHTDYILREVVVQPGGSTGWHFHDGTLYAYVKGGTLSHADADCVTSDVYPTGSTFVEPSGAANVHIGRNLGTTPVILEVLYTLPTGSPLSEDAPDPGCGFA